MKFLGWILFLSVSSHAFAQGVEIEPAPLSVEDDGTRKIITRKEGETPPVEKVKDIIAPPVAEALVIPNDDVINPPEQVVKSSSKKSAKTKPVAIEVIPEIAPVAEQTKPASPVNPVDGQLKLDGPAAATATVTTPIEKNVITPPHSNVSNDLFSEYEARTLKKYLQFSFGFLDSQYEKIHPSLDNGSTMMSFKFVADMNSNLQSGFAVEVLSDKSGQTVPDSIRVLQYRVFVDYHAPLWNKDSLRFDWVAGLGFSIGDFGIRRRYINGLGQEVSVKLKDGIIAGLVPVAGVRVYLFDQNSFDFMVEYHQYFSTPQKHIGGLAIAPRFSFVF